MYDHREMELKEISILHFYVKKRNYICRRLFLLNYLRHHQMFFVAMIYWAPALFSLFLHKRRLWEQKRDETWLKDLIKNFYNIHLKKDFRMSGKSFRELVALLAPRATKNNISFRKAISAEKRIAVGLLRLATRNSYHCIVKTFAIGKRTSVKISEDFYSTLRLQPCTYIKSPDSAVAIKLTIETFEADCNCKIPQSLGAIDCTNIFIKGSNCESKYEFYFRKQRYSIKT